MELCTRQISHKVVNSKVSSDFVYQFVALYLVNTPTLEPGETGDIFPSPASGRTGEPALGEMTRCHEVSAGPVLDRHKHRIVLHTQPRYIEGNQC